jgi:serine protease Do
MRVIALLIVACAFLSTCSGHKQFYKAYFDTKTMPDVQLLGEGEAPKLFSSDDLDRDVKVAVSKGFWPVGASSFNGPLGSDGEIVDQAKEVGAVLVLVKVRFSENRKITYPIFVPNNQTTYTSGTVYGNRGSASYSGTNTTYGSTVIPVDTVQQRYDQAAVFLVKVTKKAKFGVLFADLSQEDKKRYERNTGATADIIREESPAFLADIIPGDIIIEINSVKIINAKHAREFIKAENFKDGKNVVKILRNGKEIEKDVFIVL